MNAKDAGALDSILSKLWEVVGSNEKVAGKLGSEVSKLTDDSNGAEGAIFALCVRLHINSQNFEKKLGI